MTTEYLIATSEDLLRRTKILRSRLEAMEEPLNSKDPRCEARPGALWELEQAVTDARKLASDFVAMFDRGDAAYLHDEINPDPTPGEVCRRARTLAALLAVSEPHLKSPAGESFENGCWVFSEVIEFSASLETHFWLLFREKIFGGDQPAKATALN